MILKKRLIATAIISCLLPKHTLIVSQVECHGERQRQKKRRSYQNIDKDDDDDDGSSSKETSDASNSHSETEDNASEGERAIVCSKEGRIKHSFMRKVFSPVIGYSGEYELLHFVYDLSMWTTVGTKKNVGNRYGISLRLILKNCPWTAQYWRIRHQAVIDMQRQCGNATLFRTRAPYEKSAPYHQWIMRE